ncbi:MAG: MASE1 domain-containing protein [Candidatus Hydrogenedentes bacterium]|nr:MASE1 domain-containing protein [Candidatus Hydrogenedentota bacterium]
MRLFPKLNSRPTLFQLTVIAAIYFAAAETGLLLAFERTNATPVWPPTGIALAAVLLLGYRVWPGILAGAFFANIAILPGLGFSTTTTIGVALLTALGNTLEAIAGVRLIRCITQARNPFHRSADTVTFVAFGALAATALSATVGVCALSAISGAWARFTSIWLTWWLGDVTGALVVAPVIITWFDREKGRWPVTRRFEAGLMLLALLIFIWITGKNTYHCEYLLLPVVMWVVFRFGQFTSAVLILALSVFAVLGTVSGLGPFAGVSRNESLLLVQCFVSAVSVTTLFFSSAVYERKAAEKALRDSEEKYRALFEESFDGLFITSPVGRILRMNKTGVAMFGYDAEDEVLRLDLERDIYAYPPDRARILAMVNAQGAAEYEVVVKKKGGGNMVAYCALNALRDDSGVITAYRGSIRDITDKKRVEEALQDSNRHARALIRLSRNLERAETLDEVINAAFDEVAANTRYQKLWVYLFSEDGQYADFLLGRGKGVEEITPHRLKIEGDRMMEEIASAKGIVVVEDARTDERTDKAIVARLGNRTIVNVPIILFDRHLGSVGTGTFGDEGVRPPTAAEQEFLSAVASHLAVSFDRIYSLRERDRAEAALRRSEEEKTILNEIANVVLTTPDEEMYEKVLAVVLRVMKSPFGIFGYIASNGDLIVPSMTRGVWDKCMVPDKSINSPVASWADSLWGRALREGRSFCSTGAFHTPAGHIRIDCFLTVPVMYGEKSIGLLSVANKAEGYDEVDRVLLERITAYLSPILNARLQRDQQEQRREEAEAALRESEQKYRLLVANAGEAILIVQDGAVKFPNPKAQEITGYSAGELAAIPFTELIHEEDRHLALDTYLVQAKAEPARENHRFRILNKAGKVTWTQITAAPIVWEDKRAVLCFLKDITEQKAFEAQFLQAQKMEAVGRLAGGVAHDFNNMIGAILGHCELILGDTLESDPVRADVIEIKECAERSAALTRQLLAFSRRQALAPEVFNLNEVLGGFRNVLARLIGEDINLRIITGPCLGLVRADRGQIEQIIMNLAVNARDAMPNGGRLTIETANVYLDEQHAQTHVDSSAGRHVMLAVTDSGHGMSQETMSRVFEPFFTTKESGKGTGLGLATVYGIVRQSGGSIWVYSEVGSGTTFKVYLPRVDEAPAVKTTSHSASEQGGGETVFVVEDEDALRNFVVRILRRRGYTVIAARNGREALVTCERRKEPIDLLLTDVVMPEMGGHDLAVRLAEAHPEAQVLYMSGYTDNAIVHNGILKEGAHFIQKPFSKDGLLDKVREVLNLRSLTR